MNSHALVSVSVRNQLSERGKEQSFIFIFRTPEDEGIIRASEFLCSLHGSHVNKKENHTVNTCLSIKRDALALLIRHTG